MTVRIIIALIVHALVCVLCVVLNAYAVPIYKDYVGGHITRGADIGMAIQINYCFFVYLNIILVFVPRLAFRFGVAIFMMLSILYYWMPQHPVRAIGYSSLAGGLTICAILLTHAIDVACARWRETKGAS